MIPTIDQLRDIETGLLGSGYEAARRAAARANQPWAETAAALLYCGFTRGEVHTLFQLATRMRRYATAWCNRPTTEAEDATAERDDRLALHLLGWTLVDGHAAPRTCVLAAELSGLPGGAAIRVRLRGLDGAELRGNDFGDGRYFWL